jgi:muconolactone delta-isomerase
MKSRSRGRSPSSTSQARQADLTKAQGALRRFPSVTLVCVDGRSPGLALRAIHDSTIRAGCEFARNLIFTRSDQVPLQTPSVPQETEVIPHEGLDSIEGYNEFMMKRLNSYIETDFALIVQWDGFVLNPTNWQSVFFEYDYIGAVWPWMPAGYQVGNGGFSLRSKKLLQALQDPRVISHHPEDLAICHTYRFLLERDFSVRFAPLEVADRFSFERHPHSRSFGFHGFYNFHRVYSADELRQRLAQLPPFVYESIDATELAHNLSRGGQEAMAQEVLASVLRFRHASEIPGEFQSNGST